MRPALHIASAAALAASLPFAVAAAIVEYPARLLHTISWACRERARRS